MPMFRSKCTSNSKKIASWTMINNYLFDVGAIYHLYDCSSLMIDHEKDYFTYVLLKQIKINLLQVGPI
jgi:hypothetical protein